MEKPCRKCGNIYTLAEYEIRKHDYMCHNCRNEKARERNKTESRKEYYRQYKKKNRERINKNARIWSQKTNAYERYSKNKDKDLVSKNAHERYLKNADKRKAKVAEYRKRNKNTILKKQQQCSARLSDTYVKKRLVSLGIIQRAKEATKEQIEQIRLTLKIKRIINEKRRKIKSR